MEIVSSIEALRRRIDPWRRGGERIALVPTMGSLHPGHLALVQGARASADRVVVSVFVNPMQFGEGEDFDAYPRTMDEDGAKLSDLSVDVLFAPTVADIYPHPTTQAARVVVPELSDILCGASRPGHFVGVATVVTILFHLVQPDAAVFGEKDYQQLLIIRRLATDLHMPVTILGVPTVREADGLAMSSRNVYLSLEQRRQALVLSRALAEGRRLVAAGERDADIVLDALRDMIEAESEARIDYLQICHRHSLEDQPRIDADSVLLLAVFVGATRLIDNGPLWPDPPVMNPS